MWKPVLVSAVTLCTGCSQITPSANVQPTRQVTAQDQTAGASYRFDFQIALHANEQAYPTGRIASSQPSSQSSDAAASPTVANAKSPGNTQNTYFTISVGNSDTGALAATGGAQSSTPNAANTTRADQKPEASLAIPISVAMPGGLASGTAGAGTGNAQVTLTVEQQMEAMANMLSGGDPAKAADIFKQLMALRNPPAVPDPVPGQ